MAVRASHSIYIAYIPAVQGLIEGGTACKHATHIGDLTHIPVTQGMIERGTAREHVAHIGYLAQVRSVYTFGKLQVCATTEGIRHRQPLYRAKLFDAQKSFGTTTRHIDRLYYSLCPRFYQQFARLGRRVGISDMRMCSWIV